MQGIESPQPTLLQVACQTLHFEKSLQLQALEKSNTKKAVNIVYNFFYVKIIYITAHPAS
jgi:hypothetical protein